VRTKLYLKIDWLIIKTDASFDFPILNPEQSIQQAVLKLIKFLGELFTTRTMHGRRNLTMRANLEAASGANESARQRARDWAQPGIEIGMDIY
jgi:hypothetical protein